MLESEDKLLQDARELKDEALVLIYDRFSSALYRYAFRLLGDANAAEDIVAETFYRFLRSVAAGGGPEKQLKAYLYRVTHNMIVDRFRKNTPVELELDNDMAFPGHEDDPSRQVERSLDQQEIRRSLWKLSSDQRQVIVLKFYEGLSNQEVSEVLGKSEGAVKSLQHRALNALQRLLSSEKF